LHDLKFHARIFIFCQLIESIFGGISIAEPNLIWLVFEVSIAQVKLIEAYIIKFFELGFEAIFFCEFGCVHGLSFL
jgi:hypothetical protein